MKVQTGVANLLNEVIASVDELANLVCRIFDQLPLEEQPRYLAGWSCGDGFLLRAMFEAIRRPVAPRTSSGELSIAADRNRHR